MSYSPEGEIGKLQDERDLRFDEGVLEKFSHTLWGNSRLPLKVLDIASGFSRADANYHWRVFENVWDEVRSGNPASFMDYSPDVATISPYGTDISARFDKFGRVSGFRVDGFDQIPYKQVRKVDRTEGISAGVRKEGEVSWLPFEADVEISDLSTGQKRFKYEMDGLKIFQESYIEEGSLKLLYSIQNKTGEDLELDFLARSKINANERFQNPLAFKTEPNEVEADNSLHFRSTESERTVSISMDSVDEIMAGHEEIPEGLEETNNRLLEDIVRYLMENEDLDRADYSDLPGFTEIEDAIEHGIESLEGRYPLGLMQTNFVLGRGESELVEVEVDGGKDFGDSRPLGGSIADRLLSYVREDGGISASHNLSPMYYPSWPRDSVFVAESLIEDHSEVAESLFNDFLPEVQRENGSFNQCYHADGSETGTWYSELDQAAIVTTMMPKFDENYGIRLSDSARQMYSASVARIASKVKNGLLPSTPDYAERPSDGFRKSLWTAAYSYQGLKSASEYSVDIPGFDKAELEAMAENLKDRIDEEYFDGFFRTNSSLIGDELSPSNVYARIVTDTEALNSEQEETLLDYLNKQKNTEEFWTPGIASLGYALKQKSGYEKDVKEIEQAVETAFTEAGHLPERVNGDKTEDATELAWGLAESRNLLHGSLH